MDTSKPEFVRVVNNVTLACNLNCRLCSVYSPYFIKPWHPTLDYVNLVTDKLFELGNYTIFEFCGGEPLLRTDLPAILEHGFSYMDCVSKEFRLITNGSIIPSNDLLSILKKYGHKMYIVVDDYGEDVSINAQQIYDMFTGVGVRVELRVQHKDNAHYGGWIDFDINTEPKHNQEETELLFSRCGFARKEHFCCTTTRGIIVPCGLQLTLLYLGFVLESHEFIDLFDETETIGKKREKFLQFYSLKTLSACAYCNGICVDSKRFPPAEQLRTDEQSSYKIW